MDSEADAVSEQVAAVTRDPILAYALKRVGIAVLGIVVTLVLSFGVYMHMGEQEYAHSAKGGDTGEIAELFGPGHSDVHNFLRYTVSTFEGGLGYTVDAPEVQGKTLGYLWATLSWLSVALLIALALGILLGSASWSAKKPRRRGVIVAVILASLSVIVSWTLVVWASGASHLDPSFYFPAFLPSAAVISLAATMVGEYALLTRQALWTATKEGDPVPDHAARRSVRRARIRGGLPRVLRGVPRSFGYVSTAVLALELGRNSGVGVAAIVSIHMMSPWVAGAFFTFTSLAILVWLASDLLAFWIEGREPAPEARVEGFRDASDHPSGRVARRVGAVVLVGMIGLAVLAPVLVSHRDLFDLDADAARPVLAAPGSRVGLFGSQGPSSMLGTDELGRPVHEVILWGLRSTVMVGLVTVVVSLFLGALFAVVAAKGPPWFGAVVDSVTTYLLFVPSALVVLTAMAWLESDHFVSDGLAALFAGALIGTSLCAVPYAVMRDAPDRTFGRRLRSTIRPCAAVFGLSVAIWTVFGAVVPDGGHLYLGRMIGDAIYFDSFQDWWLWLPAGVVIFLLIFSTRLISTSAIRGSSPWMTASRTGGPARVDLGTGQGGGEGASPKVRSVE